MSGLDVVVRVEGDDLPTDLYVVDYFSNERKRLEYRIESATTLELVENNTDRPVVFGPRSTSRLRDDEIGRFTGPRGGRGWDPPPSIPFETISPDPDAPLEARATPMWETCNDAGYVLTADHRARAMQRRAREHRAERERRARALARANQKRRARRKRSKR